MTLRREPPVSRRCCRHSGLNRAWAAPIPLAVEQMGAQAVACLKRPLVLATHGSMAAACRPVEVDATRNGTCRFRVHSSPVAELAANGGGRRAWRSSYLTQQLCSQSPLIQAPPWLPTPPWFLGRSKRVLQGIAVCKIHFSRGLVARPAWAAQEPGAAAAALEAEGLDLCQQNLCLPNRRLHRCVAHRAVCGGHLLQPPAQQWQAAVAAAR